MTKTRQKDTEIRKAIRFYTSMVKKKTGNETPKIPVGDYGVFVLLIGYCPSLHESHYTIAHIIDQLVLDGEYQYGDEGRDTVIPMSLANEAKFYATLEEISQDLPAVVLYYQTVGLVKPRP